jgi:hypothetical protein
LYDHIFTTDLSTQEVKTVEASNVSIL